MLAAMAGRGKYAKTFTVQQQAVDAALQLLSTQGYSGATLQEIATQVGLTRAGLLHHFGSREGLFIEVLRRRDEVNASFSAGKDLNKLDATIDTARRNSNVPGLIALYSSVSAIAAGEPQDSYANQFFNERFALLRKQIAQSIQADQQDGLIISEIDAESLAAIFIATSDGLQIQWLLDPSIDIPLLLEQLVSLYRKV